jgi:hypothetical protein
MDFGLRPKLSALATTSPRVHGYLPAGCDMGGCKSHFLNLGYRATPSPLQGCFNSLENRVPKPLPSFLCPNFGRLSTVGESEVRKSPCYRVLSILRAANPFKLSYSHVPRFDVTSVARSVS